MNIQQQIDKHQQQIDGIQREINVLESNQKSCKHKWGETKYDPYKGYESYDTGSYDKQGVHMYPIMAAREVLNPRWTRVCSECGLVEHTEKTTEIKQPIKTKPKF